MSLASFEDTRSVVFHTLARSNEKEIKRTSPFTVASKRIRYLGINFTEIQHLYTEKYETSLKENKENLNKWKDIAGPWVRRLSMVRWQYSPCWYAGSVQSISPSWLFAEIDKLILKFIWKCKGPQIAKTILKKKNTVGGLTPPSFKTYYKTRIIK